MELGLDGGDRLADVPRLELRELGAVRDDRIREPVEEARTFGTWRSPPVTVERVASGLDGQVDVRLARHRRARERSAGGGLGELAHLARGRLG